MEHLHQALSDAGFDLCTVARDFDLPVLIPGVAQTAGAVEGKPVGRDPIDLERFTPLLPLSLKPCFLLLLLGLLC